MTQHRYVLVGLVAVLADRLLSAQASSDLREMNLEELMEITVRTASQRDQSPLEAPASVTVITAQQIRRYGYRTLAEALADVRGFYVTSDGTWSYAGVRGFNIPGDYNSRFLVMIDGHHMTDNVYSAMYMFDRDFGLNMDLVEKIEVVRGPSSALYGSNGVFATVNVITKSAASQPKGRVAAEVGSPGETSVSLASSVHLPRGATLLVSASGFHSKGRGIDFMDGHRPDPVGYTTDRVNANYGQNVFARLDWNNWKITAKFGDTRTFMTTGLWGSTFGDKGPRSNDTHNFLEAAWRRKHGESSETDWRFFYDSYRYYARYYYALDEGGVQDYRDLALGDWAGTDLVHRRETRRWGTLTFGGRFTTDIRNIQQSFDAADQRQLWRDASSPDVSCALFAQQERDLSSKWKLYLGIRLDDSRNNASFLSPRVALVYGPTPEVAYKLLYGRSFRNPSAFERFYEPSPLVGPEKVNTFEFGREQRLRGRLILTTSAYHYLLRGLIEGVLVRDGTFRYENTSKTQATGVEVELAGRPIEHLEASANVSVQKASNRSAGTEMANSPRTLAQFRLGAPLFHDRLDLATSIRYFSARETMYSSSVGPVGLVDLTVNAYRLGGSFDLQFGIRNLGNRTYFDPMSTEHLPHILPRAGRTAYIKLIWLSRE